MGQKKQLLTEAQYNDMRLMTRTEADVPEGMIGYDVEEVVKKANTKKEEKEYTEHEAS